MFTVSSLVGIVALHIGLYFLLSPAVIDPVVFVSEPTPEPIGVWTPNERLLTAHKILVDELDGPEKLVLGPDGRVYTACDDGTIRVLNIPNDIKENITQEIWADIGGRPLGFDFDSDGNIYVADSSSGLVFVSHATRKGTLIAHRVVNDDAFPTMSFPDDVSVDLTTGLVYLSDATHHRVLRKSSGAWDLLTPSQREALEGRRTGRIISFSPSTRKAEVIVKNIAFANGITVTNSGDGLLISETFGPRILKYWFRGPLKDTTTVFVPSLPGYPDNIIAEDNSYLVAFATSRLDVELVNGLPFIKSLISRLPAALLPKAKPYGLIVRLDEKGNIIDTLGDIHGKVFAHLSVARTIREGKQLICGVVMDRGLYILDL